MPDYEDTFFDQSPYDYHLPFQPPVERQSSQRMASAYYTAPVSVRPKAPASRPKALSKVQALSLARSLKRGLIVASFVGFATLSGLAISHSVGVTASQTPASSPSQPQSSPASSSSTNSDDGNQGGFFGQQQQGGSNFGSSNSNSGLAPVSHSGVS